MKPCVNARLHHKVWLSQHKENTLTIRILYSLTIFYSAFLLFLVQPLVARMLLPLLGGSAVVWNTSMVFFQALLLGGYVYAHKSLRRFGAQRQSSIHIGFMLLTGFFLTLMYKPPLPLFSDYPVLYLLASLSIMVAAPFFMLSAMSPLLQSWYLQSQTDDPNPYWLYMWSNAGSLSALIFYPLVFETLFELSTQAQVWSALYFGLLVLIIMCRRKIGPNPVPVTAEEKPRHIELRKRLKWVGLAFLPSALLLAITSSITEDISATPLLWILPLAAYLISFMVVFGRHRRVKTEVWALFALIGLLLTVAVSVIGFKVTSMVMIVLLVSTQLFASLAFHGRLVDKRPSDDEPETLTEFYVALSLGGVLGGFFVAIIAPLIFTTFFELPLLVGIAIITLAFFPKKPARAVAVMGGVIWFIPGIIQPELIHQARGPYGIHRVATESTPAGQFHALFHGDIRHGVQSTDPELQHIPLAYFHLTSPIGEVFQDRRIHGLKGKIAVIGLGIGSLAVYREEAMTFYEIDPLVEDIARDPKLFTHLTNCGDACSVVIGDGRVSLAESTDTYEVLVIDAYSGGSVPTHLATKEAFELYLSKISDRGIILFNVSNQHVDIAQIISNTATLLPSKPKIYVRDHWPRELALKDLKIEQSRWVLMGKTPESVQLHISNPLWTHKEPDERRPWLDRYAPLLPYLYF